MYPQRFLSLIEAYALAASRFDVTGSRCARRALLEYTALLDMPAEYFLDTVDIVFQRMSLALGTWTWAAGASSRRLCAASSC